MKPRLLLPLLLLVAFGLAGYLAYQNSLVPVALAPAGPLYPKAKPEYGQDQAEVEVLMPAGPGLDTFLRNQSDLTLLARTPDGALAGQLLSGLQRSRNGRRWRLAFPPGRKLQDGSVLDAAKAAASLASEVAQAGGTLRMIDPATLELRFRRRAEEVSDWLCQWRIPGSGPFVRSGNTLRRFDGFPGGRSGLAALHVATDPALLESRAWADALVARRWAWAAFPGNVAPEDMARVRESAYDQVRLKDGTVWFLSRRLRRFHPERGPWTESRLFGVWQGDMDLPWEADAP